MGERPADSITISCGDKVLWECGSGHQWRARVSDRTRQDSPTGCPRCSTKVSRPEQEIYEYISTFADAEQNNRTVISPKELDIYIESKGIAIEFNGLYWHSEPMVGREYHRDKWLACKRAGIQLITIWEDDWSSNPILIKRMLRDKIMGRPTVGARRTKAIDIDVSTARDFLATHHIQGWTRGTHYTGLELDGNIVAVMVTTVRSGTAYLDRYASSVGVQGGLSKMMKHLGYPSWVTYADHSVSDGSLYENTGWVKEKELKPDYSYIVSNRREHKFNYRLKRFRDDPRLMFEEGKTERELADINGLLRVYDAGKTKYVFER